MQHTNESPRDIIPIGTEDEVRRTWTEDMVDVPPSRRHAARPQTSLIGIAIALPVAIVGAVGLGAGYGAVMALCADKFVNVGLAFSFPFWMNAPAQLGFMWGHVDHGKTRRCVGLLGFVICFYSLCVGWLAAVLDGPGLVFNPIEIARFLTDVQVHGIWAYPFERELNPLAPWLLSIRFGELFWLFQGGFLSLGAETPFPYCSDCRRWMEDEATVRLEYQPDYDDVRTLATELVEGRYDSLMALDEPLAAKKKGLAVSVFTCEGCGSRHVMNVTWFRSTPDPNIGEGGQMLEAAMGTKLVTGLLVPAEARRHIAQLEKDLPEKDEPKKDRAKTNRAA